MQIQNIFNKNKKIYLFCRDEFYDQHVVEDNDYYPFYYVVSPSGEYRGFNGQPLKKVIVPSPYDIKKMAWGAYQSDVPFIKNYILDCIPAFDPCPTSYVFIDIEILSNEFPEPGDAKFPISAITIYSNVLDEYKTWFLGDWDRNEKLMLEDFVSVLKGLSFDLFLGWNMIQFDWPYLFNRFKKVLKTDFAEEISPIGMSRWGKIQDVFYPAGISVIDYMELFKKFTLKKKAAYNLDFTLLNEFGEGKEFANVDFSKLDDIVKKRNLGDVVGMCRIEEKHKLIPYFDDIRRKVQCLWEDLPSEETLFEGRRQWNSNNSRIIDMLLLKEAKLMNFIPPNKPKNTGDVDLQGAFRETFKTGRFTDLWKLDLSSAYPLAIFNFCLDTNNMLSGPDEDSITIPIKDRLTGEIRNTYYLKKNQSALLPSAIKKLLVLKDKIKKEMKSMNTETEEYKDIEISYASIKSIINSFFGVTALKNFRYFDERVANCTTFLVRDLILFVKDEAEKLGYEVIYSDTDSIVVRSPKGTEDKDITDLLNGFIDKWSTERYGIKTDIKFDCEGYFSKIMINTKCRYRGILVTKKGEKQEDKGIAAKRNDSSKYIKFFQDTLLNQILDGKTREEILDFIKTEKEKFKNQPLDMIVFPCKYKKSEKVRTAVMRAFDNTKKIMPSFDIFPGEQLHYCYVLAAKPEDDVLLFNSKMPDFISPKLVDWNKMKERNIENIAKSLFISMAWEYKAENNLLFDFAKNE